MSSNQPPPSPVAALHAPLQQLTLNEWDRWGLEIPAGESQGVVGFEVQRRGCVR